MATEAKEVASVNDSQEKSSLSSSENCEKKCGDKQRKKLKRSCSDATSPDKKIRRLRARHSFHYFLVKNWFFFIF
jgi:hypothetical protein